MGIGVGGGGFGVRGGANVTASGNVRGGVGVGPFSLTGGTGGGGGCLSGILMLVWAAAILTVALLLAPLAAIVFAIYWNRRTARQRREGLPVEGMERVLEVGSWVVLPIAVIAGVWLWSSAVSSVRDYTDVPYVRYMVVAEAQTTLAEAGLTSVVVNTPDGDGAECRADDTIPDRGTRVRKDETVQLVVACSGPIGAPGMWDGEPIASVSANDQDALARLTRLTNTAEAQMRDVLAGTAEPDYKAMEKIVTRMQRLSFDDPPLASARDAIAEYVDDAVMPLMDDANDDLLLEAANAARQAIDSLNAALPTS